MKKIMFITFTMIMTFSIYGKSQDDKIWIDTDIGIGKINKDVDDGIALVMALNSSQVKLEGISVVGSIDYSYLICTKLLQWYNQTPSKIAVLKGAKNENDLGRKNEAVKGLAAALRKEKISIIALGPATNIASLIMLYPELKSQIKKIVWCAGRSTGLHFQPGVRKIYVGDSNFEHDTKAGQILISSGVDMLLAGFESSSSIYFSVKDIQPLKNSLRESDHWLYRHLKNWLNLWSIFLNSKRGFIPFDAVTLGCYLYPDLINAQSNIPVIITELKDDTPFQIFHPTKPYLLASKELESPNRIDYCMQVHPKLKEKILQLFMIPVREQAPSILPTALAYDQR